MSDRVDEAPSRVRRRRDVHARGGARGRKDDLRRVPGDDDHRRGDRMTRPPEAVVLLLSPGSPRAIRSAASAGTPVSPSRGLTVASLVTPARRARLALPEGFSFCRTPDCPVAYFSSERDEYVEKADLTVRVGVKETDESAPLCYCFGWTKRMVDDEVARTGTSSAASDITERMRTTGCACERTNPSGRCCLQDVQAYTAHARRAWRGSDDVRVFAASHARRTPRNHETAIISTDTPTGDTDPDTGTAARRLPG